MYNMVAVAALLLAAIGLFHLMVKRNERVQSFLVCCTFLVFGLFAAHLASLDNPDELELVSYDLSGPERVKTIDATEFSKKRQVILAEVDRSIDQARKVEASGNAVAMRGDAAAGERQVAFLAAIKDARQKAEAVDSELGKDALRRERAKAICRVLPSGKIQDWTGELVQVATDGAGQGVLSINIGGDVHFSTVDNAFSGLAVSTLLNPNSELFHKATSLSEGQRVRFSGNLLTAADNTECYSELNLTLDQSLDGSLDAPEFVFNFSDVRVFSD